MVVLLSVKILPNDYDGAWESEGVDEQLVDKVLLNFSWPRRAMKVKYFGELFRADDEASPRIKYRDFSVIRETEPQKEFC